MSTVLWSSISQMLRIHLRKHRHSRQHAWLQLDGTQVIRWAPASPRTEESRRSLLFDLV